MYCPPNTLIYLLKFCQATLLFGQHFRLALKSIHGRPWIKYAITHRYSMREPAHLFVLWQNSKPADMCTFLTWTFAICLLKRLLHRINFEICFYFITSNQRPLQTLWPPEQNVEHYFLNCSQLKVCSLLPTQASVFNALFCDEKTCLYSMEHKAQWLLVSLLWS